MSEYKKDNPAFRIVLAYLMIGIAWIVLSDILVSIISNRRLNILSIFRGWFFIGVTATFLYYLINKYFSLNEESRQKIAASEERLSLVLQSVNDGVWDWDLKSGLAYLSPKYYEISGYREEDVVPNLEFFMSLVHPDDREHVMNTMNEHFSGRRPDSVFEFRMITGCGLLKCILGRGKVVERDNDGQPLRMLGTITDISQRNLIEQALQESEKRYRAVVEDQTETITRFLPDGTFTFVNAVYCRLFGKNIYELVGTSWQPDVYLEDLPMIEAKLKEMSPTSPIVVIENRVHVASGEIHWMQFVNRGFYDDKGQLIETQAVGRDITELKLAEVALRDSEERYRRLFEVESDAILVVDRDSGLITDANSAAVNMFGYSKKELLLLTRLDLTAEPEMTAQAIAAEQTSIPLRWIRRKDGTVLPAEIVGSVFEYQGRIVHVAAIRDITERKRHEEKLVELNEKLRTLSNHLQAVQEQERLAIARDIHDEIGQQLTALNLDIAWFKSHLESAGNEFGERLEMMHSSVDQLTNTVQRIAAELRPPLLDSLGLVAAIEWQAAEFTKHSGIECILMLNEDAEPDDPKTSISIVRIVQEALTNVARHAGATEVGISLCKTMGGLLLEIADNGRGISEQEISAIDSYGLTGMQERARLCGGELTIKGLPGAGTRLRLTIPHVKGTIGL